jgi:hypothetical protein
VIPDLQPIDANAAARERTELGALLNQLAAGQAPGWRPVRGGLSAAWRPEPDRATAWLDVTVPAAPQDLRVLIQDPGDAGIAGQLLHFESEEITPTLRRTRYAVAMPWPLSPRVFAITSTHHEDPDALWVLNRQDATPWERDGVHSTVYRSDYRLRAVEGGCRIERFLSIDLKLPLPHRWAGWLLGSEQKADAKRFAEAAARIR